MSKNPWMSTYPLGPLATTNDRPLEKAPYMDKNKKALLEDFKSDIITKQELREALALLEPESVNLLLAQFKKVNMPYDCEGCQYLVTLNDEPDEAALDEYECTGYAQECPAIT